MSTGSLPALEADSAQLAQRFLAFDYGQKHTGVATGNRLTRSATPQTVLHAEGRKRWALVAEQIMRWQPDALVVGVPCHPDGQAHENTHRARRFARQLHGRFALPVHEVDERYTTLEALTEGARNVDALAAAVILEQFLRSLP